MGGVRRAGPPVPADELAAAVALAAEERGLAVVSTLRADATLQSTVVNVGLVPHPRDGEAVLAFVTYGKVKLANLRARPQVSVTFRRAWRWATVEGTAELVGPDDGAADVDLRALLRRVYAAAGGTHDDWGEFDRVMAAERRVVVLVRPTRRYAG